MAERGHFFTYSALLLASLLAFVQLEAVVLIANENSSLVFDSADSSFTPKAPSTGICGTIVKVNPFNGCTTLGDIFVDPEGVSGSELALMSRESCSFDTKVRHAQDSGFKAVLIADNMENAELITMAGNKDGIEIPAVFISKMAGEVITQFINDSHAECCILPEYENIAWLVMVVCFISLIAITAIFAICFLIRHQRNNHLRSRRLISSQGISYQTLKCLPTIIYDLRYERGGSFDVCAVCLEDYVDGAVLRILPCNHRFHCSCIDAWLTNWQAFCPICKRNVEKALSSTESTPLLLESSNSQQLVTSLPPEGSLFTQEVCVPNSINQHAEGCHFSFSQPILQSSDTPIRGLHQSRNFSLNSLTDQDSLEAFRASPYFTPPSSLHNSAPNVLSLLNSTSGDIHHNSSVGNPPRDRQLQSL